MDGVDGRSLVFDADGAVDGLVDTCVTVDGLVDTCVTRVGGAVTLLATNRACLVDRGSTGSAAVPLLSRTLGGGGGGSSPSKSPKKVRSTITRLGRSVIL